MMTQRRLVHCLLMAAMIMPAVALPASAAMTLVNDDFESPAHTAGNPPAAINGFSVSTTTATQTVLVVNTEQSVFGDAGDSQAVRIDDNDNTAGVFSPVLKNTTALPTTRGLIIQFDYKLNTLAQNPSFLLFGSEGVGVQFGLVYPDATHEIFYTDGTNTRIHLDTAVQNQWYRATLSINPLGSAIDSWSLRLQRHDGSSVVSDQTFNNLDFRNDISNFTEMRWVFNTGPSQGGDLVVDNVLIQVIPTPAALPAGIALLGGMLMRRRAH